MQFNDMICKICSHVNLLVEVVAKLFHIYIYIISLYYYYFDKKRFYLLTKEHCYKYCPLGTCEECLVAKYHTHILYKQNLNIHYILQHCIGAPVPSLLVHLPHHLFYERHDMEG